MSIWDIKQLLLNPDFISQAFIPRTRVIDVWEKQNKEVRFKDRMEGKRIEPD